jgi:hypothetical protein
LLFLIKRSYLIKTGMPNIKGFDAKQILIIGAAESYK